MVRRKQPNPELKAIMRRANRETLLDFGGIALLTVGLMAGANSLAKAIDQGLETGSPQSIALSLTVLFVATLAFVLWRFSRKRTTWTDQMKNVVSLDTFLKMNPATALLAPNLEDQQRESVIDNLVIIAAREDVKAVLVGILPDDGNVSDSVLIKTYASDDEVRSWPRVLQTGFQRLSRYKYEIDGRTRNVQNLLFVWD